MSNKEARVEVTGLKQHKIEWKLQEERENEVQNTNWIEGRKHPLYWEGIRKYKQRDTAFYLKKSWDSSHLMHIFFPIQFNKWLSLSRGWDGRKESTGRRWRYKFDRLLWKLWELMRNVLKALGPGWCLSSWLCAVTNLHCSVIYL